MRTPYELVLLRSMTLAVLALVCPLVAVAAPPGNVRFVEQARLTTEESGIGFGTSVALTSTTALVGAPGFSDGDGAAYSIVLSGGSWREEARIEAVDTMGFGSAVAIDGDTALFRSSDAALLSERVGSLWSVPRTIGSGPVAIEGDIAVTGTAVGLRSDDWAGRVLVPPTPQSRAHAVAVSGDSVAFAGAFWFPLETTVHVATRSGSVWVHEPMDLSLATTVTIAAVVFEDDTIVLADNAGLRVGRREAGSWSWRPYSEFPGVQSLALSDGVLLAGIPGTGVLVLELVDQGLVEVQRIGTPGPVGFGRSVAFDGQRALVGAPESDLVLVYALMGGACARPGDCASGECADGVCCDRACDGLCEACTGGLKGSGLDGECGPIAAGTDPEDECLDDGAASCERNGLCDGAGACQRYPERSDCEPSPCDEASDCANRQCIEGLCCDRECTPSESCLGHLNVSGRDGVCDEAKTAQRGSACVDGSTCTSGLCTDGVCCNSVCSSDEACAARLKLSGDDGRCGPRASSTLGSPCNDGSTCDSGHCVDGVCCDEDCQGSCRACTAELRGDDGEDGTCDFVAQGEDTGDECDDDPSCSLASTCNGAGRCTSCPVDTTSCTEDGLAIIGPETGSAPLDCSPYRCDGQACLASCRSSADCAPGARCNSLDACITETTSAVITRGGCGCRFGKDAKPWSTSLAAVLIILLGFRGVHRGRRRR